MIDITDPEIKIDVFLKASNPNDGNGEDVFDIIYEQIKATKRNPKGYIWWGTNQPFTPEKIRDFIMAGQKPQALIVIPKGSGGDDNIRYVADILDSERFKEKRLPSDSWWIRKLAGKNKGWLKLTNFKEIDALVQDIDIKDYFILSNHKPLKDILPSEAALSYVYRIVSNNTTTTYPNGEANDDRGDSQSQRGFLEGKRKLKQHIIIERNPNLIREAKRAFKEKYNKLFCEICEFDFSEKYGDLGINFIEGHHKKPISQLDGKEIEMKIDDIVMLCSNCHCMIHAKKDCITVEALREIINKQRIAKYSSR
ncbi:HNH endonuclease [Clostridium tagluense]|uniref:HNH endonuclease n=1 Tax=Clostridium tagluense TaxID=360422 RepID=UPI001CF5BE30|nr:HNH endonuclease [Clostridium tagluense]MCB2301081.1 HNH endonuclease [Clostridium tagluense]